MGRHQGLKLVMAVAHQPVRLQPPDGISLQDCFRAMSHCQAGDRQIPEHRVNALFGGDIQMTGGFIE